MAVTTRMLGEHLDVSNCAYADMDPDEDGFTIRGDWAAPGPPLRSDLLAMDHLGQCRGGQRG
jgi:hypothetical protein